MQNDALLVSCGPCAESTLKCPPLIRHPQGNPGGTWEMSPTMARISPHRGQECAKRVDDAAHESDAWPRAAPLQLHACEVG